jgi:hypothetical protein
MTTKTLTIEPLNELSNLFMTALAAKALTEMMKRYPDMLPEEVLVMALATLLELDDVEPLGSARQEVLDSCLDYLKDSYGSDQLELDLGDWDKAENLSSCVRALAPES